MCGRPRRAARAAVAAAQRSAADRRRTPGHAAPGRRVRSARCADSVAGRSHAGRPAPRAHSPVRASGGSTSRATTCRRFPRPERRRTSQTRSARQRLPPELFWQTCSSLRRPPSSRELAQLRRRISLNDRSALWHRRRVAEKLRIVIRFCAARTREPRAENGYIRRVRARSSAGEHSLHTRGVAGSIPAAPMAILGSTMRVCAGQPSSETTLGPHADWVRNASSAETASLSSRL